MWRQEKGGRVGKLSKIAVAQKKVTVSENGLEKGKLMGLWRMLCTWEMGEKERRGCSLLGVDHV